MVSHQKIVGEGLGFEDVLLIPQRSDIRSRYGGDISTLSHIARGAPPISVPIVTANMDTVTEWEMAQTIGLQGGFSVIHRFMTIQQQVEQVRKVKERMRQLEDKPPLIHANSSIEQAKELLTKRERGYVIIYDSNVFTGSFVGIATRRDFDAGKPTQPLHNVMTPLKKMWTVPQGTSLDQAVKIMTLHRIQKIPIVDKHKHLIGVYTMKDYEYYHQFPHASLDSKGRILVGAAIGVQDADIERAQALAEAGVDVLVLDIAHGELDYTKHMLQRLKGREKIKTPIIAGNVATEDGAKYIRDSGADGVKVGVGPGYVCETRDVAGVGIPQITAIMNAAKAFEHDHERIPIIGDGGIRKPADIAKAIAAGADTVMVGSLFAGSAESPGEPIEQENGLVKMVRGMASATAFEKRQSIGISTTVKKEYVPEGRTTFTPYKGSAVNVLRKLRGGLLSGMSYCNAHTIEEMRQNSQFVIVKSPLAPEQRRKLG